MINKQSIQDITARKRYAEQALAIVTTAANPPNQLFMDALEQFILGEISLEELEQNVSQLKYINA